ncbi:MAG: hypothetical protein KAS97_04305, partial [Candidatus Aminicenantes bacterium]|nr:hypothetical protein [Candidatus Aminicenantes bacterium]
MKKLSLFSVLALISFALIVNPVFAGQVKTTDLKKVQTKFDPGQLTILKSADLRVLAIHSYSCICDLVGVDAFYMGNIMVDLANHPYKKRGWPTAVVVTLKYFDLMKGKLVKVVKTTQVLNPFPKNTHTLQRFVMVDHPVLVKKSVGISICVKPADSTMKDPVAANNCKLVKQCS